MLKQSTFLLKLIKKEKWKNTIIKGCQKQKSTYFLHLVCYDRSQFYHDDPIFDKVLPTLSNSTFVPNMSLVKEATQNEIPTRGRRVFLASSERSGWQYIKAISEQPLHSLALPSGQGQKEKIARIQVEQGYFSIVTRCKY